MSGTQVETFDAIVIGAGQGGGPISSALAEAGRKTALIESTHIGGTCINEGCTPTKTLVGSARVAALARRAKEYGVTTGSVSVDQAAVQKRAQGVVDDFRSGSEHRVETTRGLEWIRGEASFTGSKSILVALSDGGERSVTAETIVIDTGARPAIPEVPGLTEIDYLTSTSILQFTERPDHLVIIGAGAIALEFAQMFRRFTADVTVINRSKRLLPHEDDAIATAMEEILTEDGVVFLHEATATSVEPNADGFELTLDRKGRRGQTCAARTCWWRPDGLRTRIA